MEQLERVHRSPTSPHTACVLKLRREESWQKPPQIADYIINNEVHLATFSLLVFESFQYSRVYGKILKRDASQRRQKLSLKPTVVQNGGGTSAS